MSPLLSILLLAASASAVALPYTSEHVHEHAHEHEHDLTSNPLNVTIHSSCNSTNVAQLQEGLQEAKDLSLLARQHILETGRTDPIFQKYFGANASSSAVVGVWDRLAHSSKPGVLLRCDDVDGNCKHNLDWAGHWRGSNATSETVICDNSYLKRLRLTQMCTQGYTVANSNTNLFWASDILHRLFHVPLVSEDRIEHIADDYDKALELAASGSDDAVRNSDSLQFFALEVYAKRVAVPGVGCTGVFVPKLDDQHAPAPAPTPTPVPAPAPATTDDAPKECHAHSDGVVHCH